MRGFKGLCLFFGVLLAQPAWTELSPIPKPPENPLTSRPRPFPRIDCENLMVELNRLKGMSSDHNQAVASFMDETMSVMDQWHRSLSPLEGRSVEISKDQFKPMKDGQTEIAEVQSMVWDNMGTIEARFDEMLQVLPSCLK